MFKDSLVLALTIFTLIMKKINTYIKRYIKNFKPVIFKEKNTVTRRFFQIVTFRQ